MDIKRKENESQSQHIRRMVYGKLVDKTIEEDFAELSELVFGEGNKFNSSEVRKRFYGLKRIFEVMDSEEIDNVEDADILNKLEYKKIEIEKERKKKQAINLELNKNIKRVAINELTQEVILKSISELDRIDTPNILPVTECSKEGILVVSDTHFGKECVIKGLMGEIINEYNEEVFMNRMEDLLSQTISICNKEDIAKLNVLFTGDLIDGILRISQLRKLQYGIIDSVMKFSEYISKWLNELSRYVYCDIHYCFGNHSEIRPLGTKKGEFAEENVEKIIMWFMKSRLDNNRNINIIDSEGDFIYFDCLGLKVMASHGEEKDMEQAIKDYMLMYGHPINMFIGGHLHSTMNKSIGIASNGLSDTEYCRVKSICSIDDYSMKLRKSASAGTLLFVIEDGKGKTITYDIKLK